MMQRIVKLFSIPAILSIVLLFMAVTIPADDSAKPRREKSAAVRNVAAKTFSDVAVKSKPPPPRRPPAKRVVLQRQPGVVVFRKPGGFVYQPAGGVDALIQADRETIRRLRMAQEMVVKKQYLQAIALLQRVLDKDQDAFYYTDPEKRDVLQSVRVAAQRLIAGLPQEGRDAYQLKYGGKAQAMMEDALTEGRFEGLKTVIRRHFHSKAGYEAMYRLGVYYWDRDQPMAAALCFERLRELPAVAKRWEPTLSLRAAVCWSRVGMPKKAAGALADFHRLNGDAAVSIGGESVRGFTKMDEAAGWLARNFGGAATGDGRQTEWLVFGGNRQRNGRFTLPKQPGKTSWRISTIVDPLDPAADQHAPVASENIETLRRLIRSVTAENQQRTTPRLPRCHALVLDDVLLIRTIEYVRAVDLATGSRLWESVADSTLADFFTDEHNRSPATTERMLKALLQQRLFQNLTRGTLSSDGRRLYAVEESEYAFRNPQSHTNRLMAYNLKTGRLDWVIGGKGNVPELPNDPLNGTYFLGTPLPVAGRLYCLAEVNGEIRLLTIEYQEGPRETWDERMRLVWSQPLVGASFRITRDRDRRNSAASVSYADGVLVCNTDAGYVIGVNLTSHSLLWAYRYRRSGVRPPVRRRNRRRLPPQRDPSTWQDHAAVIADGKVLLTPRGSDELHCLNLVDGSVAWKKPRGDGLYVAGAVDGKVIVVGSDSVRALTLKEGSPAWKKPAAIATPSGRGVIAGNRLYVPAGTQGVVILNTADGRRLGEAALPEKRRPGNLVISGGTMISQGVDGVDAFPLPRPDAPAKASKQ